MKVSSSLMKLIEKEKKTDPKELLLKIEEALDLIFVSCKKKVSLSFDFKLISEFFFSFDFSSFIKK